MTPQRHVNQLLHNKFVAIIGDSIQRSVYKDLVQILQRDSHLSAAQLKSKKSFLNEDFLDILCQKNGREIVQGELSFEKDCLVKGGQLGQMNNGTAYREVRQYRTDHHLVRFYFATKVFSYYMESILADFKRGLKPDVLIVNSCVWDVSRYSRKWDSEYRENLTKFFKKLKDILPKNCLVIWNMTMPLGEKIVGGFLVPEIEDMGPTLRFDIIEANYFGATLADHFGFDVLDLHFQFRFSLQHRMKDGVHWNAIVHRKITCQLLEHIAEAWGVDLPKIEQPNSDSCPPSQEPKKKAATGAPTRNQELQNSASRAPSQKLKKKAAAGAPTRYQGAPHYNQRWFNPPIMPPFHYNYGPAPWQLDDFGPHFYHFDMPRHPTPGYQYYPYQAPAPYWPMDNLVMRPRHQRSKTRKRPQPYRY